MSTEAVDPRYIEIDQWPTVTAVEAMLEGQLLAVASVRDQCQSIAEASEAIALCLRAGGRLVYAGAGTSGRIAVQDGVELTPTYNWPPARLVFLIAGGMRALAVGVEGAEDDVLRAREEVAEHALGPNDVVIAVAASGRTPYTVAVLEAAASRGALTIGLSNNADAALFKHARHRLLVETGSEPVAGSTRMKAGTSQKVVLNLLSTAAMLRCGLVCKGLMVNMRISNAKLRSRANAITSRLAEVSEEAAASALERAAGDIRLAVLMARGLELHLAQDLLASASGNLSQAIAMGASGPGSHGIGSPGHVAPMLEPGRRTPELSRAAKRLRLE
ncbi:N-acetylmuramic acid 6-phosphate etherase [Pseudoxanthomonas sp.]|uniref:N-acetylmuramic acid 6-phosphate etherase n=1 Tax=Pseudoxanthomonas sp. TaxID=1871049 RepID=UPI00262BE93A|nr:N-acetylmuramic acid 6-phosphate etherase [Pseudoxanthomonas sp.]WDS35444.1 MAG: N-acetylmuramic acid 6-phosphate etherase [Pseudoxanthomonas sp.]